ncbi:MAG: NADH-quinone oxidoreductase subunit A [Verrucomicrobiota bacterium]|nr:NADH-quinone oxidoreductase subunit A [Verrucomicrobiota bacterium]
MMGLTPILMAFVWTRWTGTAKPDDIKNAVYECGLETGTYQWFPLKVEYYIYGIIFLVFDVEILFLLPIASVYKSLPAGAIAGILVFIFLLMEGLVWAWAKGLLRWQFTPSQNAPSPAQPQK